jgi:hypothetical protein
MALLHTLVLAAERMNDPRASSSLFLADFSPHQQEPPQELMILLTYPSP